MGVFDKLVVLKNCLGLLQRGLGLIKGRLRAVIQELFKVGGSFCGCLSIQSPTNWGLYWGPGFFGNSYAQPIVALSEGSYDMIPIQSLLGSVVPKDQMNYTVEGHIPYPVVIPI